MLVRVHTHTQGYDPLVVHLFWSPNLGEAFSIWNTWGVAVCVRLGVLPRLSWWTTSTWETTLTFWWNASLACRCWGHWMGACARLRRLLPLPHWKSQCECEGRQEDLKIWSHMGWGSSNTPTNPARPGTCSRAASISFLLLGSALQYWSWGCSSCSVVHYLQRTLKEGGSFCASDWWTRLLSFSLSSHPYIHAFIYPFSGLFTHIHAHVLSWWPESHFTLSICSWATCR